MQSEYKIYVDRVLLFVNKNNKEIIYSIIFLFLLIFFYISFISAPKNYPTNTIYNLKQGQTLSIVSNNFSNQNIIKSKFFFKSFIYIFSLGRTTIIGGNYALNNKENVISIAWRVTNGILNIVPVKITIPEGLNSYEIADVISRKIPAFNPDIFINLVKEGKYEGYLFPDTYFIMPDMNESQIIKMMNDNFNSKIKNLEEEIKKFGRTESDVIKMASILEEEARTVETRETIAGILWKRIDIKMPLQVDSSFKYINGKNTSNLTTDDLKIDSPYNSYTNRGLPPTPISNPGLEAINDAINPIKTPYLYFLNDKNGNMHYSVTFDEHIANKLKYLK